MLPYRRRTYLHKKYLFKKGFALFTLIFLTGSFSLTAHAEEETDTAGSSLGKEVIDSFNFYELATCDSSSVNGFKTVKDGGMPITMVVIPQTPGNALMVNGIVLIPMAIWSPDGRGL